MQPLEYTFTQVFLMHIATLPNPHACTDIRTLDASAVWRPVTHQACCGCAILL